MPTVETVYSGKLRTTARHVASGLEIITDAPVDNMGQGQAFSPTDLLAASLGSCMLTVMGITCQKHGIEMDGTSLTVTKVMASGPRRVSEIQIEMKFPEMHYTKEQKEILENAALTCPVAQSLHPGIKQDVRFIYR